MSWPPNSKITWVFVLTLGLTACEKSKPVPKAPPLPPAPFITADACDDAFDELQLALVRLRGECTQDTECVVIPVSPWYQARARTLPSTPGGSAPRAKVLAAVEGIRTMEGPPVAPRTPELERVLTMAAKFAVRCPAPPEIPTYSPRLRGGCQYMRKVCKVVGTLEPDSASARPHNDVMDYR